jgi:HD-GYP domain-containing protein (c-di-GMP phosphodiesterase class II)
VITRFQTRAFLFCFVPFLILLGSSFWTIQRVVESTVHDGLHASLRASQSAIAAIHAKGNLQNSRVLNVAGEDIALKAGIQQLVSTPHSQAARKSVEDQLRNLGEQKGFDLMLVSAPDGSPLVGVVRESGAHPESRSRLVSLDTGLLYRSDAGFRVLGGRTFQVASVPVSQDEGNRGFLSVGRYFDLSDLKTPVVLVRDGKVIESNIPGVPPDELERGLARCTDQSECNLHLNGSNWIALPIHSYEGGYELLSFENLDAATAPLQAQLRRLFLTLALSGVLVVFLCSIASSTSIVKPIAAVVSHLRSAAQTGILTEMEDQSSPVLELRELAEIYNRAAISVRAAGENLESAYLEFVGSLASALDVRDGYTSGHSRRVSQLSCAVAAVLQLDSKEIERIRVGAMLHDIGKIGISDTLLQKSGRLTSEEFEIVKEHPIFGRRILEGVQGFQPYLGAVELHHENWDGTGYPKGLKGDETPIDARIIHVADAYDAMTTNRSYRRGMTHKKALSILVKYAGTQFDPRIVDIFVNLPEELLIDHSNPSEQPESAEEPSPAAVA